MTTYKNAYELANKRKKKDDFATALSELKTAGGTSQKSLADSFNSGYTLGGGQGNGLNNMASMLGQGLAGMGSSQSDSEGNSSNFGNMLVNGLSKLSSSSSTNSGVGSLGSTSTSGSSGFLSKFKGGSSSGGGGVPWALIGSLAKGGYNSISGKDDKDYSDVEESVIYPLQGASIGSSFGPWGALAGALYGWSYGLKDDTNKWVGIKEGSFWDKLRHPIGMGDGGGFIDLG
jgi:hypothetical protein